MTMRAPHYSSHHTIVSSSSLMHHQPRSNQHASSPSNAQRKDKILAERFKTQMCRNYEKKGSCPYENKCMFAHGDADLRTPEMNVRDGLFTEESIEAFRRAQRLLKKRANQAARQQQQAAAAAATSLNPHTTESFAPKDNSSNNKDQIVGCNLMDTEDAVPPATPAIHADSSSSALPSESSSSVVSSVSSSVGEQENADAFGSYPEEDDVMNQSVEEEEVLSTSCKMTSLLNNPNIIILNNRTPNGSQVASGSPSCNNTPRAGSRYRYNPYSASSSLSKV